VSATRTTVWQLAKVASDLRSYSVHTTSNSSGGIEFDVNSGSATVTTLLGDSLEEDGTTFGVRIAFSSLSTVLCG
jgi:hypothetical protein